MLFNSLPFLFGFLPACLLVYFLLARAGAPRLAGLSLALASLAFYGYWSYSPATAGAVAHRMPGFVALLCVSTMSNYLIGYFLQRSRRQWLLVCGIAANIAILGYYKYSAFGVQTLNAALGWHLSVPHLILPLAISFYTFTQIAFLVDAYRGLTVEVSFPRYCLFVFFFPHLIAGPIVHHSEIMPQFALPTAKLWNPANFSLAVCWLTIGLFKKVVIADSCAPLANASFAHAASLSLVEAWCGVLAYAFQLYFDFSGYSDMAIGISLFFNVRLPDNFNAPYRATSIIDFWRRWHITLSRFLRDYLYIPLGGNRYGPFRRYLNLFVTMLLGGIWHGAGWTFLLWGAYHGILLIFCHLWSNLQRPLPSMVARSLTLIAVLLGWLLFRAADLTQAGQMLSAMCDLSGPRMTCLVSGLQLAQIAGLLGLLVFVNVAPTTKNWVESRSLTMRHAMLLALLFVVSLFFIRNVELQFSKSEFIYFQF